MGRAHADRRGVSTAAPQNAIAFGHAQTGASTPGRPIRASSYRGFAGLTADRVEWALITIEKRDRELGQTARLVADILTAGGGEEAICQASLQTFLWSELPRKFDPDEWIRIVRGATALLDELDLHRYALLAGSVITHQVLRAWQESPRRGWTAYRKAAEASGVLPPDTNDFEWGTAMGLSEVRAFGRVEVELERALTSRELLPGGPRWKPKQRTVTEDVLRGPDPDRPERTLLDAIRQERVGSWVGLARPEQLQAWRAEIAETIGEPEPMADPEPAVRALRWFLALARGGVHLTQAGYLPPASVREAAELFGWWEWPEPPRTEADVHQFEVLRELASRLRLVAKRGHHLMTTASGLALLDDPEALWRLIAPEIGCQDEFHAMLTELLAHRLLHGPVAGSELETSLLPIVEAQGWRTRREAHPTFFSWEIYEPWRQFRTFWLIDVDDPPWATGEHAGQQVTTLSPIGRATAIRFLRSMATGPQKL